MITTGNLWSLCNKHRWFTHGTNRQYEKMFNYNNEIHTDMNGEYRNAKLDELHILSYLIWICSDDEFTQADIVEKLIEVECRK